MNILRLSWMWSKEARTLQTTSTNSSRTLRPNSKRNIKRKIDASLSARQQKKEAVKHCILPVVYGFLHGINSCFLSISDRPHTNSDKESIRRRTTRANCSTTTKGWWPELVAFRYPYLRSSYASPEKQTE